MNQTFEKPILEQCQWQCWGCKRVYIDSALTQVPDLMGTVIMGCPHCLATDFNQVTERRNHVCVSCGAGLVESDIHPVEHLDGCGYCGGRVTPGPAIDRAAVTAPIEYTCENFCIIYSSAEEPREDFGSHRCDECNSPLFRVSEEPTILGYDVLSQYPAGLLSYGPAAPPWLELKGYACLTCHQSETSRDFLDYTPCKTTEGCKGMYWKHVPLRLLGRQLTMLQAVLLEREPGAGGIVVKLPMASTYGRLGQGHTALPRWKEIRDGWHGGRFEKGHDTAWSAPASITDCEIKMSRDYEEPAIVRTEELSETVKTALVEAVEAEVIGADSDGNQWYSPHDES